MAIALTTPVFAAGAVAVAVAVAVVVVSALLAHQEQRWRRFGGSMQSLFLPDGTPAMPATALGQDSPVSPGMDAVPGVVQVWPERTAPGQSAARSPAEPEHINTATGDWLRKQIQDPFGCASPT